MGNNGTRPGLADPTQLKPLNKKKGTLQVIIETPKGSRNKFAFDEEQKVFTLKSVLPAGMAFPYDFGFLPQTKGGDGDPLDVLVLMDEPAFPGCMLQARLLGVLEGEQIDPKGGKPTRNDRILAVHEGNHTYATVESLKDLPKQFIHEIEQFFVNYHHLEGKEFKILGCKDKDKAMDLIKEARAAA